MRNRILAFFLVFLFFRAFPFPQEKKQFELAEIIDIGLKNNPLLLANLNEVEARKASFQASKLLSNPALEFHKGSGTLFEGSTARDTEGISLGQHVENPVKRHYRVEMREKSWKAAEYLFSTSKLDISCEIKKIFYKILLLQTKEELAQRNLISLEETHELILKRVSLGEARELEAIKLHVETLKARNELLRTQTESKLAKESLNKFLGNVLPEDFSVRGKLDFASLDIDEKPLLEKALLSHPLIKAKEKELEYAECNVSYVKWQRLPDIKLSGFINKELDGKNKGVGLSFDIPLWNFKSREIEEAESLFLKQGQELKALKMEISNEVKLRLNEQRLAEQTLKLFHQGLLRQAEESLKISAASYKQGEISLIDYLDSQRTYYSILKDYQDSLYDWNVSRASLEKVLGEEIK